MKLVNTETLIIKEFYGEQVPAIYAVLSHQWSDTEVSYQEWSNWVAASDQQIHQGFEKILSCCLQARKDEIQWLWVDTCCIDKSSSQEVSEAINSMFNIYRQSQVCYVYLRDYYPDTFNAHDFEKSDWFSRGWTLQELLAPDKVNFYNAEWHYIESKHHQHVAEAIFRRTNIEESFLLNRAELDSASVAKRMSWASERRTTRPEDEAYCLMGLFDINMPLLYGEGKKAFMRLQEEIMKAYPGDHSLYAWEIPGSQPIDISSWDDGEEPIVSADALYGLLADSPRLFKGAGRYSPLPWADYLYIDRWEGILPASYPLAVGKVVNIELPIISGIVPFLYQFEELSEPQIRTGQYAVLLCRDTEDEQLDQSAICLPLVPWGWGYLARPGKMHVSRDFFVTNTIRDVLNLKQKYAVAPEVKPRLKAGDVVLQRFFDSRGHGRLYQHSFDVNSAQGIVVDRDETIRVKDNAANKYYSRTFRDAQGEYEKWTLILGRTLRDPTSTFPSMQVAVASNKEGQDDFEAPVVWQMTFEGESQTVKVDIDLFSTLAVCVKRLILPAGGIVDVVAIDLDSRSLVQVPDVTTPSAQSGFSSSFEELSVSGEVE